MMEVKNGLNKAPKKTEWVYIVQQGDTDYFKVGFTTNMKRRLSSFYTLNPHDVKVVGKVPTPNGRRDERRVWLALGGWVKGEWCIANKQKALKALKIITPTA